VKFTVSMPSGKRKAFSYGIGKDQLNAARDMLIKVLSPKLVGGK